MFDVSYEAIAKWLHGAQRYARKGQQLVVNFLSERAWEKFKQRKKIVVEGVQVIIDGVSFIVDDILNGAEKLIGEKRRAIGLGVSLIAGSDCDWNVLDESMDVMDKTSEMLLWMVATHFEYKEEVACKNIGAAFKNVEYFLKRCVNTGGDPVYKDTAKLVRETYELTNRFCTDKEYQRQLQTCGCRCNCTHKNTKFLKDKRLVFDEEMYQAGAEYILPNVEDVCLATEKLSECEKKNCLKLDDDKAEVDLARSVDRFCRRHEDWEPLDRAEIVPTDESLNVSEAITEPISGTTSLETAFRCLLLIICMVI